MRQKSFQATMTLKKFAISLKSLSAWNPSTSTKIVQQEGIKTIVAIFGAQKDTEKAKIDMWQLANIEFTNQDDYEKINQKWAVPFKADLIRIFPFICTNEHKQDKRQIHSQINQPSSKDQWI